MTQSDFPSEHHRRLNILAGSWDTSITMISANGSDGGTSQASDIYTWMPNGHFLIHDVDAMMGDQHVQSTEIFGVDRDSGVFFSRSYDPDGSINDFVSTIEGRDYTISGRSSASLGTSVTMAGCCRVSGGSSRGIVGSLLFASRSGSVCRGSLEGAPARVASELAKSTFICLLRHQPDRADAGWQFHAGRAFMNTYVILLRAIGPVTHKLMSMEKWRDASAEVGFSDPRTVGNTGNMLARFQGDVYSADRAMTGVLRSFELGENVVPILRKPRQVGQLLKSNPIPEAALNRPSQTGVYFFASSVPDFGWLEDYQGAEIVHVVDGHLVVDFAQDVAKSGKLIRLINKHCGLNTSRSWSSIVKITLGLSV